MKKIILIIVVIFVVGVGAFFGGMKYVQSKSPQFQSQQNLSPQEIQQRGGMRLGRTGSGGGFVAGEIISKDDKSITIKLRDGGSKIVFFSDATEIGKFVAGAQSDLVAGKSAVVNGKANSDGSITAQSIQLRPQLQN